MLPLKNESRKGRERERERERDQRGSKLVEVWPLTEETPRKKPNPWISERFVVCSVLLFFAFFSNFFRSLFHPGAGVVVSSVCGLTVGSRVQVVRTIGGHDPRTYKAIFSAPPMGLSDPPRFEEPDPSGSEKLAP